MNRFVEFDDNNVEHYYESLAEWQGGDYELHQLQLEEDIEQLGDKFDESAYAERWLERLNR